MPRLSATEMLPPTRNRLRPNCVLRRNSSVSTASSRKKKKTIGKMLNSLILLIACSIGCGTETGVWFVMVRAMPLYASCIVMETMKGERRNVATKKPVTAPQAQPTAMADSSASRKFICACSIIMKIQAESAMTEPNEISS